MDVFCFFKNCSNFIDHFFNETSNPEFYTFIAQNGFKNISITDKNEIKFSDLKRKMMDNIQETQKNVTQLNIEYMDGSKIDITM